MTAVLVYLLTIEQRGVHGILVDLTQGTPRPCVTRRRYARVLG